jgi:hypothetical protein
MQQISHDKAADVFETHLFISHMLQVWYIYLHNWVVFRAHVGKYSSTMEHMGIKEPDVLMFLERIYKCQKLAKIEWNLICNWLGKNHRSIPTKWLHPSNYLKYPPIVYGIWTRLNHPNFIYCLYT